MSYERGFKMKSVFVVIFTIFLIFNVFYVIMYPTTTNVMTVGAVTGLVGTIIGTAVIGGIQIFGSGLNSESVKIVFGVGTLLNLLFRIEFPQLNINLGLGLATNIIDVFTTGDLYNIGFYFASGMALIGLVSGLMVIVD